MQYAVHSLGLVNGTVERQTVIENRLEGSRRIFMLFWIRDRTLHCYDKSNRKLCTSSFKNSLSLKPVCLLKQSSSLLQTIGRKPLGSSYESTRECERVEK